MIPALLALALTVSPVSKFVYKCQPPDASRNTSCTFDGSKSTGAITLYTWDWGTGQKLEKGKVKTNTFKPGVWRVRLTVTDSSGVARYSTQLLTLPIPPRAVPPPVACVPVVRVVHDTIGIRIPQVWGIPFGVYVDSTQPSQGAWPVFRLASLGRVRRQPNGTVSAQKDDQPLTNPKTSPVIQSTKHVGLFPSLAAALTALGSAP